MKNIVFILTAQFFINFTALTQVYHHVGVSMGAAAWGKQKKDKDIRLSDNYTKISSYYSVGEIFYSMCIKTEKELFHGIDIKFGKISPNYLRVYTEDYTTSNGIDLTTVDKITIEHKAKAITMVYKFGKLIYLSTGGSSNDYYINYGDRENAYVSLYVFSGLTFTIPNKPIDVSYNYHYEYNDFNYIQNKPVDTTFTYNGSSILFPKVGIGLCRFANESSKLLIYGIDLYVQYNKPPDVIIENFSKKKYIQLGVTFYIGI